MIWDPSYNGPCPSYDGPPVHHLMDPIQHLMDGVHYMMDKVFSMKSLEGVRGKKIKKKLRNSARWKQVGGNQGNMAKFSMVEIYLVYMYLIVMG